MRDGVQLATRGRLTSEQRQLGQQLREHPQGHPGPGAAVRLVMVSDLHIRELDVDPFAFIVLVARPTATPEE